MPTNPVPLTAAQAAVVDDLFSEPTGADSADLLAARTNVDNTDRAAVADHLGGPGAGDAYRAEQDDDEDDRETYAQNELDQDRNPTEQGYAEYRARRLADMHDDADGW